MSETHCKELMVYRFPTKNTFFINVHPFSWPMQHFILPGCWFDGAVLRPGEEGGAFGPVLGCR